jgi:hypothetical protein
MAKYTSGRQKNLKVGLTSYSENLSSLEVIGAAVFTGESSGELVRISQIGTGPAFLVEDSANPDVTPFVITKEGKVAIGVAAGGISTSYKLEVDGGDIRFVTGSQGDLIISHSNLVSNIRSAGTVQLGLGANGGDTIRINLDNNVGIGTTTPTSKLYVVGDGYFTGIITASSFGGNALSATYASTSGIATYATTSGVSTFSGYANTSGFSTFSGYANNSGLSTYATTSGFSTFSGYANNSGLSTYATTSGFSTFSGYANNSGLSTYATTSGVSTYATTSGFSTFSGYANNAGLSTYATTSGVSTYATTSGFSTFSGYANNSGLSTYATTSGFSTFSGYANNAGLSTYATTAGVATALQNARTFQITGDIIASPISFNGTGNVSLAATIQPNSVALGTDTSGDYVANITGTSNQITVTSGTGESSTPTLSLPSNLVVPQDLTVTRDLQVNRNLNVTGNITIGGTTAFISVQELVVTDPDIILGYRTDAFGNDISNDTTANHGGVALASTEGNPLVDLFITGIETAPATYKKIMWFKSGTFSGLGTDAWLVNYAVGIGSTQFPTGTRLAAGSVQFTENDLAVVRNINASGVVTASSFSGNASSATYATSSGIATYATTSGVSTYSGVSGFSTFSGYSNTSGFSTFSGYSNVAGIATYATTSGVSTYSGVSGFSTFSGYSNVAGIATYATTSGVSTFSGYANTSGFSTFSGYSNVAGIATYATTSGVSTYSGVSGFSTFSGYANNAGLSTYATTSGVSTFSGYANTSGFSTFSGYANNAGLSTYATTSGFSTFSGYSTTAGVSTYAVTAGVSTSVIGGIGSITQLQVTGVSTFTDGPVLIGSGTSTGTATQRLQVTGGAYVSGNTGIGTTNPTSKLYVDGDTYITGILTANRIFSSIYGEFTGGSISGSNIVGTSLSISGISTLGTVQISSGVVTATTFVGSLTGTATSTTNIPNLTGDITSSNTATTLATVNSNVGTYGDVGAIPSITVNAKGLVTGVTTVAPNNGQLSLGVSGTGLSGSATFTANQSGSSTFTVTSNATDVNTSSTIVARDASGNFSAGTITANLTGTATTATNLADAANITTGTINSARLSGTYSIDITGNATTANYATNAGIATYATNAGIATYATNAGIATYATSSGIATYATAAGVSTNLKGGVAGNVPYQSATDTTTFVTNGTSGQVLLFNGSVPIWGNVSAASGSFGGISVQDEGVNVGTSNSITTLNFIGSNVNVTATSGANGIATVTIANNLVGTALSISGISTLGTVRISSGIITATSGIVTYYGDGSQLSGVSGGLTVTDDTSTNATRYILFDDVTSGTVTAANVSSTKLTFNPSTGNLVAGGTVTANSDKKLKTNIKTIENALHKVLSIRGVEFDRIDTGDHQIGVIAQEVEEIIPEVVYPKSAPDYETKSVAYANLVGLLIEAVKEQNQRIVELERKLEEK